jgi:hypothetical protein
MKTKLALSTLKTLLALSMVTSFVACTTHAQDRKPANMGTQDSGGGNGLTEGVYDSFVVDVRKLPAYIKFIKPIFDKLDASDPTRRPGKEGTESILRYKTWYLAPMTLSKISKDVIGFSSSEDENIQYAIQTKNKIVIDKNLFDGMVENDPVHGEEKQAWLLLHEMTMSLYLQKYVDLFTLNKTICANGGACDQISADMESAKEYIKYKYAPEKFRPLNADDYDHIRTVTAWIMNHGLDKDLTSARMSKIFQAHNFDKRFFNQPAQEPSKDIKISDSGAAVIKAYQRGSALGTLPVKCYGIKTKILFDCTLEISKGSEEKVQLKSSDKGEPFITETPFFISLRSRDLNISVRSTMGRDAQGSTNQNSFFSITTFDFGRYDKCEIGGSHRNAMTFLKSQTDVNAADFNGDKAVYDIAAMLFMQNVIFQIDSDQGMYSSVRDAYPKVTSLQNDAILMINDATDLKEAEAMAKIMMTGLASSIQSMPCYNIIPSK